MVPHPPAGHPPQVQHRRLAGGGAVGVAVDQQVLVEAEQRVVERRAVRPDLDAGEARYLVQVAAVQLDAPFQAAGRALLLGAQPDRGRLLVAEQ